MAGAVSDEQGRILIAKRPDHVHQGGLWEFPGGKLEPGETPEQGLSRELAEELGIQVYRSRPLIRVRHDYGDRVVLLDVHRVESYSGTPSGCEGQPLDWQHPDAMRVEQFPAADRPIINALRLPALFLITGSGGDRGDAFLARLERALLSGVRLVQLRAHGLSDAAYGELARGAFERCEHYGARLLLNRSSSVVERMARHGLHLSGRMLMAAGSRPGESGDIVGASCHDARELAQAEALGLDYAVLSPVRPTASHPDAVPLGWARFAELVDQVALPVYALGGLTEADCSAAFTHGGQGIAAIRGLWPD